MGLTMVHAQDTVTTLYLAIFMSSFSLWPHHETLVYVDKRD
jgi:hypothetical protein